MLTLNVDVHSKFCTNFQFFGIKKYIYPERRFWLFYNKKIIIFDNQNNQKRQSSSAPHTTTQ